MLVSGFFRRSGLGNGFFRRSGFGSRFAVQRALRQAKVLHQLIQLRGHVVEVALRRRLIRLCGVQFSGQRFHLRLVRFVFVVQHNQLGFQFRHLCGGFFQHQLRFAEVILRGGQFRLRRLLVGNGLLEFGVAGGQLTVDLVQLTGQVIRPHEQRDHHDDRHDQHDDECKQGNFLLLAVFRRVLCRRLGLVFGHGNFLLALSVESQAVDKCGWYPISKCECASR